MFGAEGSACLHISAEIHSQGSGRDLVVNGLLKRLMLQSAAAF